MSVFSINYGERKQKQPQLHFALSNTKAMTNFHFFGYFRTYKKLQNFHCSRG